MARNFRKNVGVLGLGIIGRRIADHLRHRGLAVFVWNRTPRPVPNFVGSPGELAETCDFLQIFVSDDDALMRMIQVILPSLRSNHLVIAHPTVSPDTMREAALAVERRGARLVEAPFTGSKSAAEKGELVYYVGGDEGAVREARPLLSESSKAIVEIGGIGQASIIKVATNMVTAASVQSAAEALSLVHYSGIPLEKFAEAMKQNGSNSATLDMKVPAIVGGNFEPYFSVKHMLKDMQIANRLGRGFDLDLTVAGATRDRLLDEARQGHGDDDYSAIARRFLPFIEESEQLQPDLFSQAQPEPAHEEPEFVAQQLAEVAGEPPLEEAIASPVQEEMIELSTEEPDVELPSEAETLTESPTQSEPESVVVAEVKATEAVEPAPARAGFLSRLLRKTTDY